MELTHLLYFRTIAECGTISKAADQLHVSQPALSMALKKLEKELGTPLFMRSNNHLVLNDAGRTALAYASDILSEAEEMRERISRYSDSDHIISIAFCDPGPQWFFIPKFSMANPQYEIRSSSLEDRNPLILLQHGQDIVVTSHPVSDPSAECIPLISDRVFFSAAEGHPLSALKEVSLRKRGPVSPDAISLFAVDGAFLRQQLSFWEKYCPDIRITKYTDYFVFHQVIQDPRTITITTELVRHYRNDGLHRCLIPAQDPEMTITYYLLFRKENRKRLEPFILWASRYADETAAR